MRFVLQATPPVLLSLVALDPQHSRKVINKGSLFWEGIRGTRETVATKEVELVRGVGFGPVASAGICEASGDN